MPIPSAGVDRRRRLPDGASARGPRARRRPASARTAGRSRAGASPPRPRAAVAARRPVFRPVLLHHHKPSPSRSGRCRPSAGRPRCGRGRARARPAPFAYRRRAARASGGPPRDHSVSATPQLRSSIGPARARRRSGSPHSRRPASTQGVVVVDAPAALVGDGDALDALLAEPRLVRDPQR